MCILTAETYGYGKQYMHAQFYLLQLHINYFVCEDCSKSYFQLNIPSCRTTCTDLENTEEILNDHIVT